MNKKVGIIIGGILLILAIIAAVFLLKGNKDTNNECILPKLVGCTFFLH